MRYRTSKRTLIAAGFGRLHRRPMLRDGAAGDGGNADNGGGGGKTDDGTGGKADDTDDGTQGKKPKLDGDYDSERALRDLGKARDDAKREKDLRVKAEQAQKDKLDSVLVALGLKPDPATDPAATAAKVAQELATTQQQLRAALVESAVIKAAGKAGADPGALTDSRAFVDSLADLDPAAADFADRVAEAIRAAVKANPRLAAQQSAPAGPGRVGADHTGGGGGRSRPAGLGAAIAARMGGTR